MLFRSKVTKKQSGELSETLEPDGHLPGFKDGLGVFPPDSDWAKLMLALKLKGELTVCPSRYAKFDIVHRETIPHKKGTSTDGERWTSIPRGW